MDSSPDLLIKLLISNFCGLPFYFSLKVFWNVYPSPILQCFEPFPTTPPILELTRHTFTHSNSDKDNLLRYMSQMYKYQEYSSVTYSQGWCWRYIMTGRAWATTNQKQMPCPIKRNTSHNHQHNPTGAYQLPVSIACSQGRSTAAFRPRRLARDREYK